MDPAGAGLEDASAFLQAVKEQMSPVLIGCCLNIVLYGIMFCWQFRYWISYRDDQ